MPEIITDINKIIIPISSRTSFVSIVECFNYKMLTANEYITVTHCSYTAKIQNNTQSITT